jgi:hypothetical protein
MMAFSAPFGGWEENVQPLPLPGSTREREREADRRFKARLWGSQVIPFTYEQLAHKRTYWGSRCYLCGEVIAM